MFKETWVKNSVIPSAEPELESQTQSDKNSDSSNNSPSLPQALPIHKKFLPAKTFIANYGPNPLLAAASALFSLLAKLQHVTSYSDIRGLRENLIHEIKAFEYAAFSRGYSDQFILLSRYALCTTIDDVIQSLPWGQNTHWNGNNLLYYFHREHLGGERFLNMYKKLLTDPKTYIDLLELLYVCFSFGFGGPLRYQMDGGHKLNQLKDELHTIICNVRGELPSKLSKWQQPTAVKQTDILTKNKSKAPQFFANQPRKSLPIKTILAITVLTLGIMFVGFNMLESIITTPLANAVIKMTD